MEERAQWPLELTALTLEVGSSIPPDSNFALLLL